VRDPSAQRVMGCGLLVIIDQLCKANQGGLRGALGTKNV
jgi:hypothetical protein